MHLLDRGAGARDVVGRLGQLEPRRLVRVLEVGQVDVDRAVEQPQRLERVVAVGVVDQRQREAAPRGDVHRPRDLRRDVARRDEADVVAPLRLQLEHDRRQPRRVHLARVAGRRPRPLADLRVLAMDAVQVAAAEEDVPRAARLAARQVRARQDRLLAEVRGVAGDDRAGRDAAELRLAAQPIDAALPRTDDARREPRLEDVGAPREFAGAVQREIGGFGNGRHASIVPARRGARQRRPDAEGRRLPARGGRRRRGLRDAGGARTTPRAERRASARGEARRRADRV